MSARRNFFWYFNIFLFAMVYYFFLYLNVTLKKIIMNITMISRWLKTGISLLGINFSLVSWFHWGCFVKYLFQIISVNSQRNELLMKNCHLKHRMNWSMETVIDWSFLLQDLIKRKSDTYSNMRSQKVL